MLRVAFVHVERSIRSHLMTTIAFQRFILLGAMLLFPLNAPRASAAATRSTDPFIAHPAAAEVDRFFNHTPVPADFKPTGLMKKDYLDLISTNIDFWKHHPNDAGAIIDPYAKGERQYSTPAFALASAVLVKEAGRDDLLDASTRAMSFATRALANKTTADGHADFYIPAAIRMASACHPTHETSRRWRRRRR